MEWATTDNQWKEWVETKPVLKKLYEERVFSVGKLKNGAIGFVEECDTYFSCEMTKDEVRQLAHELLILCDEWD